MDWLEGYREQREIMRSTARSSFRWRIPEFLSREGCFGDNYYLSPEFYCCDERWWIRIYPMGMWPFSELDTVSVVLYRCGPGPSQSLHITLGIVGAEGVQNKKEVLKDFSDDDRTCAWLGFCRRSELREHRSRLLQGEAFVLTLDMKVKPSFDRGGEKVLKSLRELLAGGEDSDVSIKVWGKKFPAHRNILRARSPVFQAMFAQDAVEEQSGVVTMNNCNLESFPAFLEHIYTGSTGMISSENVFDLHSAADEYDLGTLKEACREFMQKTLNVDFFSDPVAHARTYQVLQIARRSSV